ncbi:LacI family DNA-binding transcriptional regulator [Metabacillus iocasae]|uniref:DNA-binding LacI/PurR family transcriptional regulator n=1 Tax=Priestia iocasae TaxID=2291674 RepID=A0ABS2QRY0_9BACI|nr:LacI family DNA-binding transcriptional regulator [Metabacillus iocasae]MBM7702220.1 DNA-binding LacI/PurR family transcriptional regulator [Metabacillus iocasae]
MPNIDEIAKICKVSKTTVSRVLNNHPYVSEEKRKKILDVIKELDYSPNSLARHLRTNKTRTIAISIPSIDHPFFSQLTKGISNQAFDQGYKVLIYQTFYKKEIELETINLLKNKEIDGVILCSLENEWSTLEPYLAYGPILLCNEYHESAPIPIICYDEFKATYIAVKHLIQRGHTNIGFCFDTFYSQAQAERMKGFSLALKEENLLVHTEWIFDRAFDIKDGFNIFKKLDGMAEKPTAIFTGSDQVAAGIIKEAISRNYHVPKDLAVIGFDNQLICQVTTPTITSIGIPIFELGRKSVQKILENIQHDENIEREVIQLPFELIIREST